MSLKKRIPLSPKKLLLVSSLLFLFSLSILLLFGFQRDEKLFSHISSQLFVQEMKASTLNMHYTIAAPNTFGIYDYEPTLPIYDAASQLSGQAATENLLSSLAAIHPAQLSSEDAYAYILLKRSLENSFALNQYEYYGEPLSPSSGMQSQLPILLAEYTFRTRQDVEDYLALLDQTDEYFASLLQYEQEKAESGLLMAASSLKKVRKQCDSIVALEDLESEAHFLQTTFAERTEELIAAGEITAKDADAYYAQNNRLLKTVMVPAYEALGDGLLVLEDTDIPLTGLGAKPKGREYYEHLLISETGSYRPIEDIEKLLTARLKEEYTLLQALFQKEPSLSQQLAAEQYTRLPYLDAATMLTDLQQRMAKDFPSLTSGHHSLPAVTVKNVSANLEEYTAPAFYLTPPFDDTDTNVIYINQKNAPDGLELYTTLAHEGYPGHLYQTVYNNHSFLDNNENKIRQLLWYGGYLEGWALYVEFISYDYASALMEELNRPADALCIQAEKHNRSLQLCLYSILDIMIHYENASYSQVTEFLESFGITNPNSAAAIYAYIAEEPCNYLKYYLGYLEILELQKTAMSEWGAAYSDYAFHSFYLDCGPSDFTSLAERLRSSSQLYERID